VQPKPTQLIVTLPDYGAEFVERVRQLLEAKANARWPACKITVDKAPRQ